MTTRATLLALATALTAVSQAQFYDNSYTFHFNNDQPSYTVSRFYILESRVDPDYSFNYGFRLPSDTITSPQGGTITDYDSVLTAPATESLIIAETDALPGENPNQKHVLLGMSNDAAGYAHDIAWGTLFRNTLEEDIIAGLDNYVDSDPDVTANALQHLVDFAQGDAKTGIVDTLEQSHSAWFTPGGSFTLMTWSDGAIVGTGTSTQLAVPEPSILAFGGFGMLLVLRRRKRS